MKANSGKSHVIMSCIEATTAIIDSLPIDSSKTEVFLGIKINHKLKFDDHVNYAKSRLKTQCICLYCTFLLTPIAPNVSKKRIIESQFGYFPLL